MYEERIETNEEVTRICWSPEREWLAFLSRAVKTPLLTAAEERELLMRCANGDREARERVVKANLRLAIRIAFAYRGMGVPVPDLVQAACQGLVTAVNGFDCARGLRFSTYATPCIKGAVLDHMEETLTPMTVTCDGQELSAAGVIADPAEDAEIIFLREDVHRAMSILTKRETEVIVLLFGLNGFLPMTTEQTAQRLHTTAPRVSRIRDRALDRIRCSPYANLLLPYLTDS